MANLFRLSRWSRLEKTGMAAMFLVLLYGLFGFFAAPAILKDKLISTISDQLGRKATVGRIKVNPFALSLSIEDFEIRERDGKPFAGFERLDINFQLSSLFRRAYTFKEIKLSAPDVNLAVLPDGSLNTADLMPPSAEAAPGTEQFKDLPPLRVFRLEIERGRLAFTDRSHPTPFEAQLSPIQIALPNFSTLQDSENQYAFQATSDEGEGLKWTGNFSIAPFRVKGEFALSEIKARTIWNYIQDSVFVEATDGKIDLAAHYEIDTGGKTLQL